jgi:hypothetical protein
MLQNVLKIAETGEFLFPTLDISLVPFLKEK